MYYSLKMASNSFLISQPSLYTPSKTNSFIKFSPPQNPLKLKNINSSFLGLFNTKKMTHFDQKVNAFDEKNSAIVKNIASCYLGLSITKKRTHFDQIVNAFDEESSTIIVEEGVEVEEEKGGFKFGNEEEGVEVEAIGDGGEEEVGGEYEQVSEDAKLFVGNLPFDVDSEKLAHLFEQAGIVEIAEVIYNRATDQSRGFGFVTMSAVEEADKAVDMLNRYVSSSAMLIWYLSICICIIKLKFLVFKLVHIWFLLSKSCCRYLFTEVITVGNRS
ncbi:hypothetical protein Leryth_026654 [Lithospermum erythrorhizon]|nr:hypothetical protein Leryth_026654 [Lithospermum erythrorhizon]